MSDNIIWIVDQQATASEAPALAGKVKAWLLARAIVAAPVPPVDTLAGADLLRRGPAAAEWDAFPAEPLPAQCGLEIVVERQVFHTGGNGVESLRCPACGTRHDADEVAWSDAVEGWYVLADDRMACGTCNASPGIADWTFEPPWGFGHLGFGFWNWPVGDRLLDEISALTGHQCRIVHEHV